jgi:hypothetical protein
MSKYQPNTTEQTDMCTTRLKALSSYVDASSSETIAVNGKAYTPSQIVAMYQECLDTRAKLDTQRAQVRATQRARDVAEVQRRAVDRALKPWVINKFGDESQQAIDFGFPPAKKPTRTVKEKTNAVALSKATREARHTMGKRQKEAIKGTIPASTEPAAPATTDEPSSAK